MEVSGDRFANARQRLAHGGGHHIDTSVIRCLCRNDSARVRRIMAMRGPILAGKGAQER